MYFIARNFLNRSKESKNTENNKKKMIEIWLKKTTTKNLNRNLKNSKRYGINEPSQDYVGLTGPELNSVTLGLWSLWLSALGLFQGRKSKNFLEQNVIIFQFYLRKPKFRHLGWIMKKKIWLADPLKFIKCLLESTVFA